MTTSNKIKQAIDKLKKDSLGKRGGEYRIGLHHAMCAAINAVEDYLPTQKEIENYFKKKS